jgi:hypothetical protein
MGENVDQALSQLATTREQLDRDLDELFHRLPEPAVLAARAKTYGMAAGGAAVTVGALAMRQRKKSALKARREDARINAEELARAFSPHPPPEPKRGRGGLLMLAATMLAAGAVAVMRSRAQG